MRNTTWLSFAAALALANLLPAMAEAEDFPAALIDRGHYLATASDCAACHTNHDGGKPLAGGLKLASPVGTIVSSNITPSKQFGIGDYTEQQFSDALRKGIRADGANLYPAMPYTAYSAMSDADIHALYAYFMKGVAPVDEKSPETSLPFPMNIRTSMIGWNLLFANGKPLADDPGQSGEWNRGRYLAEGPAHCGTCHTPRGFLMQEETSRKFGGSQVGPWYAPDITADKVDGIGSWTQEELVAYLKSGHLEGKAQAAGSMAEAVTFSFSQLTDADLKAIATYVLSVPPAQTAPQTAAPTRFERGSPGNDMAAFRGRDGKIALTDPAAGAQIFSANCASCHGFDGQGTKDGYYPSLFHNSATGGSTASNLIATILFGVNRETAGGHVFMPAFGDQPSSVTPLDDAQVASLSNYILTRYGNNMLKVSPDDVKTIRDGGPQSNLIILARVGIGAGIAVFAIFSAALLWARRRRLELSR